MKKRDKLRVIPSSARYYVVDLGELGEFDLRFPSFGKAARLLEKLSALDMKKGAKGISQLVDVLDVTGCAIGMWWANKGHDLESGRCPDLSGDEWRDYGDAVVDELQEHGLGLGHVMALFNAIVEDAGRRMSEVESGESEGNG